MIATTKCLHTDNGPCATCIADMSHRARRATEVLRVWQERAITAETRARELEGNPGNALLFRLQRRVKHLEHELHAANLREAALRNLADGGHAEVEKRG